MSFFERMAVKLSALIQEYKYTHSKVSNAITFDERESRNNKLSESFHLVWNTITHQSSKIALLKPNIRALMSHINVRNHFLFTCAFAL